MKHLRNENNRQRKGQAIVRDLGIHTKLSAYSKTEGAKRLPLTINNCIGVR